MSSPNFRELVFDDRNKEKLAARRIAPEDVYDLLAGAHAVVNNKKRRSGVYKVVGRDRGGRTLTVVMEPAGRAGVWRPVTGWISTEGERTLVRRKRR